MGASRFRIFGLGFRVSGAFRRCGVGRRVRGARRSLWGLFRADGVMTELIGFLWLMGSVGFIGTHRGLRI